MQLWQAVILAAYYWLSSGEIYVPFTYCFCDLMLNCTITGFILGDPVTGAIVGGTIQPLYLALTAVGGAMPVDKEAAVIVTTSAVITQGISLDQGLVISSAAALICAQLHTIKRIVMVWTVHHADKAASEGDIKELYRTASIYGPATRFVVFMVPMIMILTLGVNSLSVLQNMPEWLNRIFSVAGGMMPALGFAMTILVIGKGQLIPFFVAGFFFAAYTGFSSIPGALLGIFLAWLYTTFTNKGDSSLFGDLLALNKRESTAEHVLPEATVKKVWRNWRLHICHVDNVERLQALGMCCAMAPALEELYPDNPEYVKEGLTNHMQFFITENLVGGLIPGVVLSMEEQRAIQRRNGVPEEQQINNDLITSIKTGMMGPFAGIGDTLNYATVKPLMSTFFMGFAQQGHVWAPILDDVLLYTFLTLEGRFMYNLGYKLGTESATEILQNNAVQKIITFFSVVGLFVMGVMAYENVGVQFGFDIPYGATDYISFQETLVDAIAPGLLSLLTVFGIYNYLKRGGTVLKATLGLLGIAAVLGGLGVLG